MACEGCALLYTSIAQSQQTTQHCVELSFQADKAYSMKHAQDVL